MANLAARRSGGCDRVAELVIGSGARLLVEARGCGEAREGWPRAADAMKIREQLRYLAPKPLYGRAPDARVPEAA